jgi:peroxiredoxin
MIPSFCLLGCLLAPAQAPARTFAPPAPAPRPGAWAVAPRLDRAQELVYRGSFTEESTGPRVEYRRAYAFETRVFVLASPPRELDVALLTTLKDRDAHAPAVAVNPASTSVRLERARVDLQGRLIPADPAASVTVPLDGPPTIECGAFVELPEGRVRAGQTWDQPEPGRPARTWRVAGAETVNSAGCVKLVATQQSEDWGRPRADRAAWRRQDTVWLSTRLGVASRVERVIEQREPAHTEPTHKSVLRYDLDSSLVYPGQLAEDRRQEILRALSFHDSAAPLLPAPARHGPQLAALFAKINYHLDHQPPTPYREAVAHTKRRVEAARRGEVPSAPFDEGRAPAVAEVGRPAPDFLATDLTAGTSARLRRWLGKPVLLVFYHPRSLTAPDVLSFAQRLSATYARGLQVVGLSVSDDAEAVKKQKESLKLTFPLLGGGGLRVSYAVETTPKFVLVDPSGVVRGAFLGWGRETPSEVLAELRPWLKLP